MHIGTPFLTETGLHIQYSLGISAFLTKNFEVPCEDGILQV